MAFNTLHRISGCTAAPDCSEFVSWVACTECKDSKTVLNDDIVKHTRMFANSGIHKSIFILY